MTSRSRSARQQRIVKYYDDDDDDDDDDDGDEDDGDSTDCSTVKVRTKCSTERGQRLKRNDGGINAKVVDAKTKTKKDLSANSKATAKTKISSKISSKISEISEISESNKNKNTTPVPLRTQEELSLSIESNLHNMGKALTCPLCLATLRQPVLLPCVHAFCQECITTSFSMDRRNTNASNKNNHNNIPNNKHPHKCPVCKAGCSKRGMVPSRQLEQLVKGYKLCLRSFGLAPVVYDEGIGMTQIEEEISFSMEEDDDDDDDDDDDHHHQDHNNTHKRTSRNDDNGGHTNNNIEKESYLHEKNHEDDKAPTNKYTRHASKHKPKLKNKRNTTFKKHTPPSLLQCHEHLEVSRAIHDVLKKAVTSCSSSSSSRPSSNPSTTSTLPSVTTHTSSNSRPTRRSTRTRRPPSNATTTTNTSTTASSTLETRRMSALEMERQNKFKKLNYLLKNQEKVIEVGERALVRAAVSKHRRSSQRDSSAERKEVQVKDRVSLSTGGDDEHVLSNISCTDDHESSPQNISDITSTSISLPPRHSSSSSSTARGDADMDTSIESPLIMNDGNTVKRSLATTTTYAKTSASVRDDISPPTADTMVPDDTQDRKPSFQEKCKDIDTFLDGASDNDDDNNDDEFETADEETLLFPSMRTMMMTSQEINESHESFMDDARENEAADRSGEWDLLEEGEEQEEQGLAVVENDDGDGDGDGDGGDGDGNHDGKQNDARNDDIDIDNNNNNDKETRITIKPWDDNALPQQQQSQNTMLFLSALSQPLENDTDPETTLPNPNPNPNPPSPLPPTQVVVTTAPPALTIKSVVNVQSRTWPGVNKPGGVARIKKVHDDTGTGIKYDVAYILGGRERLVDCVFVSPHEDGQDSFVAGDGTIKKEARVGADSGGGIEEVEASDAGNAMEVRRKSTRVSRRISHQVLVKVEETRGTKRKVEDIKEEQEVKKEQGRRSKRNRTTEKKNDAAPTATAEATGVESGGGATRSKKRKAGRPSAASKKNDARTKRQRRSDEVIVAAAAAAATKGKPRPNATKGKKASKASKASATKQSMDSYSFTVSEMFKLAKDRCDSLLRGGGGTDNVVKVVTSGLSDYDESMVKLLCTEMRGMDVTLKLWKDFNPQKANLCITTSRPSSNPEHNHNHNKNPTMISNKRTVKTMRAALAGLPLLTPEWISACLQKKSLVSPEDHMTVHTLPTKVDQLMESVAGETPAGAPSQDPTAPSARYGVATFAARFQKHLDRNGTKATRPLLLNGVSFFLCGRWQDNLSKRRDVQILLREAGSTLLSSGAQVVKKIKDITTRADDDDDDDDDEDGARVVFICYDSKTDNGCGITNNITKAAQNLTAATKTVDKAGGQRQRRQSSFLVVNTDWLFDCISCASILGAEDYEPSFPSAKSLWQLCTSS